MRPQRRGAPPLTLLFAVAITCTAASLASGESPDLFEQIYARGAGLDESLRTLTARFTETTSSPLLDTPIVTRGRVAVERPGRVALQYDWPDRRAVIIDDDRMLVAWPGRGSYARDVGQAWARANEYFVGKSPRELRRHFDISATVASDRPGTWRIAMVPRRKQIREGLARLELWVRQDTVLLDAMRMTFPGGDVKMMIFDDVVMNGAVDKAMFQPPR